MEVEIGCMSVPRRSNARRVARYPAPGPHPFPPRFGRCCYAAQASGQESRWDAAEGSAEKETSSGRGRRSPPTPAAPGAEQSGEILPGKSLLLESPNLPPRSIARFVGIIRGGGSDNCFPYEL